MTRSKQTDAEPSQKTRANKKGSKDSKPIVNAAKVSKPKVSKPEGKKRRKRSMRSWLKIWNKAWEKPAFKYAPFRRQVRKSAALIMDVLGKDALPAEKSPKESKEAARWERYKNSLRKTGPIISKEFIQGLRCAFEKQFVRILMDAKVTGEITSPSNKPCKTLKTHLVNLSAARELRPWQLPDRAWVSAYGAGAASS